MKKFNIRLIGDVHGKYRDYVAICKDAEEKGLKTLQLGDMGFDYMFFDHYNLSPDNHKFIPGNHDNYAKLKSRAHSIGDYGLKAFNGFSFFFVRGAYSIDKGRRTIGRDWWPEEELGFEELRKAIEEYEKVKPDFVLTHTAPDSVKQQFCKGKVFNSRTETALKEMWQIWQPNLWVFGHFHVSKEVVANGTKFICLNELSFLDI